MSAGGKPRRSKARQVCGDPRRQPRGENRLVFLARHEHGPLHVAVDAAAHGGVLLPPDERRRGLDAIGHMTEEPIERQLAALDGLFGPAQRLHEKVRQEPVAETTVFVSGLSGRGCCEDYPAHASQLV